jgi:hypothetical protein
VENVSSYLDKYMNDILTKIYANQNLCKYLYYDTPNPLSLATISDTKILYDDKDNQRIYDTPFNMSIMNKDFTTLTINVNTASIDETVFYKDIEIEFFIICSFRDWNLTAASGVSALRPNAIISELTTLFSRKSTVGIGKNHMGTLSKMFSNGVVGGYRLSLSGMDFITNG